MKPALATALAACTLLVATSCSCSKEAESETSTPQGPQPVTEVPPELLQGQGGQVEVDPFTGRPMEVQGRITELPADPFFQEHNYPGSRVIDVKFVFMAPTVWLHTEDSYEDVDAHYRKLFTKPDGEVGGRAGRYYRQMDDGTVQKVTFSRAEDGGTRIALSM